MKKISILTIIFTCFMLSAQKKDLALQVSPAQAEAKLKAGNYEEALDDYLSLLDGDDKNVKYLMNVAICYLNGNGNKAKAVPYLEKITRNATYDPNSMYLLGRAYHYAKKFDNAIACLTNFKITNKGSAESLKNVDQEIEYCHNAKELMKYPIDVRFENLGNNINSPYEDYFPYVTVDENVLIYNTRRPTEKGEEKLSNGTYKNSIALAKVNYGVFDKPVFISPLNTKKGEEQIVGLSANGQFMLIYHTDATKGNLYIAEKNDKGEYLNAKLLESSVNSSADEISASINSDGTSIYFASNRAGGLGGTDLYVVRRLPNGKWGEAENLGNTINTAQDEDFPNISPDGNNLFFSSKGHTSMGGFDIFKSKLDPNTQKFVNAQNVGYPLNTTYDDYNFRISYTGRYGYLSTIKDGGQGEFDIYRIVFNNVESELSVIKGQLVPKNTADKLNYKDVFMSVADNETGEIIGNYLANPNTGRYVIILPPGKYELSIEYPGAANQIKTLEVFDKGSFQAEVDMDLQVGN